MNITIESPPPDAVQKCLSSDTPETDALLQGYAEAFVYLPRELEAHARSLERERDKAKRGHNTCAGVRDHWKAQALRLREEIRLTIMENLGLADGEVCTLKRLKDAIKFELPPEP